jgi:hypothetical protein
MCLTQLEKVASIIQALATAGGLCLGAGWSLWLFLQRRSRYPRATMKHAIAHKPLGNDKLLLRVAVGLRNIGEVLMSIERSETRIYQVAPLILGDLADSITQGHDPVQPGETEVEWPMILSHDKTYSKGDCEIEPGETQDINHDFIIGGDVKTVAVYSYVMNEKKRARTLAWTLTTLYD